MLPPKDHEANPQSCLNQAVVQHNVRVNGKLLREEPRNMIQQLLERPHGSRTEHVSNRLPSSKQMQDQSSGKMSFKMMKV